MIISAAGGHNLLMIGPLGTGKTMLASRICLILPPLDESSALETAALHSRASISTSMPVIGVYLLSGHLTILHRL
jgi:predicted ATPase with chaperone activity